MPKLAGLLIIIAGSVGILGGAIMIIMFNILRAYHFEMGDMERYMGNPALWLIFMLYLILNCTAIIGGAMSIKRKAWNMALTGAICSLVTIWGWSLGVISLVFLIISKDEFEKIQESSEPVKQ